MILKITEAGNLGAISIFETELRPLNTEIRNKIPQRLRNKEK